MARTWDYVIIGAGSAGCVLAARLSEDKARRVILIEAGGWDWSPRIRIPGLLETALGDGTLNWRYMGDPDPSLNGRSLMWAAGRVVGGSSSINGMVYGRGLRADYARWTAAGNDGWGWDDMAPYFKRLEHWTGPPHPARGETGPVCVRPFTETDAACASTLDALVSLGTPRIDDYCSGVTEGVALTQVTQRRGLRHSVAGAYLRRALRRPNLTVLTGTRALSLLFRGDQCVGVRAIRRGRMVELLAERETIVCAGAIGTPKLLMLSGVGPADSLKAAGIEVRHDAPGVGANMNDHVNVKLSAFVNTRTYNSRRRGLPLLREAAALLLSRTGAATSPANHVQAFVRTDPNLESADVQLQVMPFGFGDEHQMARDGFTVVVSPCHPGVRGKIGLTSPDPLAPPRIKMEMLSCPEDRAKLLRGCKLASEAIMAGPGRTMAARIYAPSTSPRTDEDWLDFFRATAALNWHPTSTCRIGPGDEDVVDGQLRVKGLTGLSIADASIMPFVTSANTNAPVIAIAERAAEFIAARTS